MSNSKPRKALFNRPAWAAPRRDASDLKADEDRDFFSRADGTFDPNANINDRESNISRSQNDADRRNAALRSDSTKDDGHASKRRRLSLESEADDVEFLQNAIGARSPDGDLSKTKASVLSNTEAPDEGRPQPQVPTGLTSPGTVSLTEHAIPRDSADRGSTARVESAEQKSHALPPSDHDSIIATRHEATSSTKPPPSSKHVVSLDSDDEEDGTDVANNETLQAMPKEPASATGTNGNGATKPAYEDHEEDEELARHIRQARERMREEQSRKLLSRISTG